MAMTTSYDMRTKCSWQNHKKVLCSLESPTAVKMEYRVCISVQPGFIQLEDDTKWNGGQVNAFYPTISGGNAKVVDLILLSLLGDTAPNMSLVMNYDTTGSVGKDGTPTGCYAYVHNNQSDLTVMPVEYPIYDYNKVNPIQIIHEGPLDIMSNYKVEDKESIIYADLLESSLKSFDINVWYAVLLCFFVFSGLLLLRIFLDKRKKYTLSPIFETFCHMIGQDSTEFEDISGELISVLMTIGFFLILVHYLNLMSTDLVVVTKPHVIDTYRDIMDEKDITVAFMAVTYDADEFEEAEEGTIQEEFWKMFSKNHMTLDSARDPMEGGKFMEKVMKQKGVLLVTSMMSQVMLDASCKMLEGIKGENTMLGQTYSWLGTDPDGKQHTTGLITNHGLNEDPLIIKGRRRLMRVFEGSLFHQAFIDSVGGMADMMDGMVGHASAHNIHKCLSKTVNFNHPEVENVHVGNFKYLTLVCLFLLLVALFVLISEKVYKMMKTTRVQPL